SVVVITFATEGNLPNNLRLQNYSTNDLFGASRFIGIFVLPLALLSGAGCQSASHRAAPPAAVRFALAADPQTLNPLFGHPDAASVEQQAARLVFEPFVDLDAHGRAQPALLSMLPARSNGGISADGRTIVYRLRRARWSDGVPVTSADVLFTLRSILDPRNPVRTREGYDLIDRAEAPDEHTVVVHLTRAWAPAALTYFSYGLSSNVVVPAHVLRAQQPLAQAPFNAAPSVGDGPYRFESWRRGDALQYAANPLYWRGRPAVAALWVRIVPDPSTNLLLMQSGQLDWNLVAPAQLPILRENRDVAFVKVPTAVVAGLAFNTRHAPLDDVRVRRAIAFSIDRD